MQGILIVRPLFILLVSFGAQLSSLIIHYHFLFDKVVSNPFAKL